MLFSQKRFLGWLSSISLWTLFLVMATSSVWAGPIKEAQARKIANQFFATQTRSSRGIAQEAQLQLSYAPMMSDLQLRSTTSTEAERCFYVYNNGDQQGYAVVAGDDRLPEILGYSHTGSFNYAELPAHFKAFIDAYVNMIQYLSKQNRYAEWTSLITTPLTANHAPEIAPLLNRIKWGQTDPFNLKCPETSEAERQQGAALRMPVGCVATATSQVMRYYQWPKRGVGSYSYTEENGRKHSVNFEVDYDWKNMPEEVFGIASDDTKEALSTLCYHVGVAVDMSYGVSGSGAYMPPVAEALKKHFKYSKQLRNLDRRGFPLAEWERMMRDELNAKRPLIYSGAGDGGGHAFVCDGYDARGRYHFNWGWNGSGDNYFYLPALSPSVLGTGGGTGGGFSLYQSMIVGVEPDRDGNSLPAHDYLGSMVFRGSVSDKKAYCSVLLIDVTTRRVYDGSLRLEVAPLDSNVPVLTGAAKPVAVPMHSYKNWNVATTAIDVSTLRPGRYRFYAAYESNGVFIPMNHEANSRSESLLIVSPDGSVSIENPVAFPNLTVVAGTDVYDLNQYSKSKITLGITNHTSDEFFDRIRLVGVYNDIPTLAVVLSQAMPQIAPNGTTTVEFDMDRFPFAANDNVTLALITEEYLTDDFGSVEMKPYLYKLRNVPQVKVPQEIDAGIVCSYTGALSVDKLIPLSTAESTGTISGIQLTNIGTQGKKYNPFLAQFFLVFPKGVYIVAKSTFDQSTPLNGGASVNVTLQFSTSAIKSLSEGTTAKLTPIFILKNTYSAVQKGPLLTKLPLVQITKKPLGQEEVVESGVYQLYPVPATDAVTLCVPEAIVGEEFLVWSASGELLSRSVIRSSEEVIAVDHLTEGIYFVRVGNKTLKLIKK